MADNDSGEKTEEPTQQRRDEFRKRGQVAQSKEVASVLMIFTALFTVWMLGRFFLQQISEVFHMSLGTFIYDSAKNGDMTGPFLYAAKKTFLLVGPVAGMTWVVSFMSSIVQVGFLTNEEALSFKFDRINPVAGFKKIFSLRALVEGLKAVVKLIFVSLIAYLIIESEIMKIPYLVDYSVEQIFSYVGVIVIKLLGAIGFFMAVLAGMDFFFQKWELEQQMRMTKQEVKEEHKSREGDPLIKARIRRTQREMSQKRMMTDVPKADVIITNPTHIAVALKYSNEMVAPTVIAKGADKIAEKIKELAKENRIPIVENKPLARTIFKTIKIGQIIPKELYTAVAEVLSYVYRLKKKRKT